MATTRKKAATKKAATKKTGTKSETATKPRASSAATKPRASSTATKPRATSATATKSRAITETATKPRSGKSSAPSSTAKSAAKGAAKSVVKAAPAGRAKPVRAKPTVSEDSAAQRVALAVAAAALDKKAVNVEIIDVTGKVDYADYVVVMSGTSDRQVSALARGISEDVEKNTKSRCLGVEGLPGGAWVLMDFGDVVVHIFHHDVRGYYDLESLWLDAARLPVPGSAAR